MTATAKKRPPKSSPPPPPAVRASAPPAADPPEYRDCVVALEDLRPSPTNPRKTFDGEALAHLADSIRQAGLAQPIVARPVGRPDGPAPEWSGIAWRHADHFEVVAGERRRRACGLAGHREVRVSAALLTDEQVLYLQLVENDQREDVKPSERAAAYARLAAAGKTALEIAAATGLHVRDVRDLIKLAGLPAWMLAAVDRGEVPVTTAALVARIPDEGNRRKASAEVLFGGSHGDPEQLADDIKQLEAGKTLADLDPWDPVATFRETKEILRRYQRELKGQPWRKALDLVAGAPPCDQCPKRAGNAAKEDDSFAEVRADTCLDVACFEAKAAAWGRLAAEKAEKKGRTVVPADQAGKVFYPDGGVRYGCGYLDPDERCYDDDQERTYGELLKGKLDPVVAIDHKGAAHDLYDAQAAAEVLKRELGIKARAAAAAGGKEDKAERARRLAENRLRREFHREVYGRAADAAWQAFAAAGLRDDDPTVNLLLRRLAKEAVGSCWGSAIEDAANRRGITGRSVELRSGLEQVITTAGAPAVLALLVELHAAKHLPYGRWSDTERKGLAGALGLNRAEIERTVKERLKAEKAAKGKGAKPKAAPAAARTTSPKKKAEPADDAEDDAAAGQQLADLADLPAEALDLLDAAGCLTVGQAWAAAEQAADDELRARPRQDVLAAFMAEIGAEGHLVHVAATALTKALARADGQDVPPVRKCRGCGCTQDDCRQCIEKTGAPCSWVEPDLCSACVIVVSSDDDPAAVAAVLTRTDLKETGHARPRE